MGDHSWNTWMVVCDICDIGAEALSAQCRTHNAERNTQTGYAFGVMRSPFGREMFFETKRILCFSMLPDMN